MNSLRVLNPKSKVVWRVLQCPSEIRSLGEVIQGRPYFACSPGYAGDDMACRATIMNHEI
jgi:hypothetical protein